MALRLVGKDVVPAAGQQTFNRVLRQEPPWPKRFVWKRRWLASSLWLPATGFEPAWLHLWVCPVHPMGEGKEHSSSLIGLDGAKEGTAPCLQLGRVCPWFSW